MAMNVTYHYTFEPSLIPTATAQSLAQTFTIWFDTSERANNVYKDEN
jgi:hypothetical protein